MHFLDGMFTHEMTEGSEIEKYLNEARKDFLS